MRFAQRSGYRILLIFSRVGFDVSPNNLFQKSARRVRYLLQLAKPAQRDGRLRVIDFMAATESPDSNSVKAGSFD
jgi:hypothetical protein